MNRREVSELIVSRMVVNWINGDRGQRMVSPLGDTMAECTILWIRVRYLRGLLIGCWSLIGIGHRCDSYRAIAPK